MPLDLVIRNGTVVTPELTHQAAIGVDEGLIVAIGEEGQMPDGEVTLDASGLHVLPGLIDAHVHFREPGLEYKEDFSTGSAAAACGGITTVVDMPNTVPPTADVDSFLLKKKLGEQKAFVDFALLSVILQTNLDHLLPLHQAGVIGFKVFLAETLGNLPTPDDKTLQEAFRIIAGTGRRTGIHGESWSIVNRLMTKLQKEGRKDSLAHVESRPPAAALEAVNRAIGYAQEAGMKLHDFHEGCKEVIELIREHKKSVDVTCETAPHYLLLTAEDMEGLGNLLRINPPIRPRGHQEALWEGLKDGTIDLIATDHSPHTPDEKSRESIWDTSPGFPGVETNVSLMLTQVNAGKLTLNEYVRLASERPAQVWQMHPRKGSIAIGADGDFTIVDLNQQKTIRAKNLHSKNRITPFDGWKVKGVPRYTIVRGNIVMKDGEIVGPPRGRCVHPVDHRGD